MVEGKRDKMNAEQGANVQCFCILGPRTLYSTSCHFTSGNR